MANVDEQVPDAWWVIHSSELNTALHRAHRGEDPELLYMELYANSETEGPECDSSPSP